MSREMIVGGEHMVGHSRRHHDYDELMELGAEPHPHGAHAPAKHGGHQQHGPPPPHGGHGGHVPMHPGTHGPAHGGHAVHSEQHMPGHSPAPPATREIHHHYAPPPPPHASHEPHHETRQDRNEDGPKRRRLVAEEPTNERQFPIGFMLSNIAPNDEEDIEVKPQVYFRGERLAIPPTIARYFDILDIKVGKDSQLAATGTMPGESFSALAVGVRMELDTAKPGIVITLRVRNIDTAPHDFKAVMYGAVLE